MKLIEFENNKGIKVFINPERVAYVKYHKELLTYIYFASARSDAQIKIVVVGTVGEIASRLQLD
jgi:hypothetical protein